MDCYRPDGWEIVNSEADCPEGYSVMGELRPICQPFKNAFCCSQYHSGAHSDCKDLVLNGAEKRCAFVDDIHDCDLPSPWRPKPADMAAGERFCPSEYEWTDDLDCGPGGKDKLDEAGGDTSVQGVASPERTRAACPVWAWPFLVQCAG
jgi:hypothetical protein